MNAQTPAPPLTHAYFATAAAGIETVTAAELERLGARDIRIVPGGVHFQGDLRLLYSAHLHIRTASRIVRLMRDFAAITPEMLYSQTRRVRWEDYLNPEKTLAVYATIQAAGRRPDSEASGKSAGSGTKGRGPGREKQTSESGQLPKGITHSKYAALKIKDAIVDRLRREQGARPNVDTEDPDIRVQAHFSGGRCTLSLDASGASLHERGYRLETTAAPLKETLAAAIIELTNWDGQAPLVDPMCGSGTLLIEAAQKALRIPPGLARGTFGFQRWPDYDSALWRQVRDEAESQIVPASGVFLFGSDCDPKAISAARANAKRAGVEQVIRFTTLPVEESSPSMAAAGMPVATAGIIVTNPPYGARLGNEPELQLFYERLGEIWQQRFPGWKAYVLAGNLTLARNIGLQAARKFKLHNGPLECRLLEFEIAVP